MKLLSSIILTLITTLSFGQRIELTLGPILDPKQIRNDVKIPRVAFGGMAYSSTLFFNPEKRRPIRALGSKTKPFILLYLIIT